MHRNCHNVNIDNYLFMKIMLGVTYVFVIDIFSVDKLHALTILLEAFGNSRTILNTSASRYSQLMTIDYDHSGQMVSASVQVTALLPYNLLNLPSLYLHTRYGYLRFYILNEKFFSRISMPTRSSGPYVSLLPAKSVPKRCLCETSVDII